MIKLILFNKPYGVISQFSPDSGHLTLKDYISIPQVYPAGRLDADSEGLMLLTNNGKLQAKIAEPKFKKFKTYWVQIEGSPSITQLQQLAIGVNLGDFITSPAEVKIINEPHGLWVRVPPIRFRKSIATTWLELSICEGKNRQIRRMSAKVGLPTLRLIRVAIGGIGLANLAPGEWREISLLEFNTQF